MRTFRMSFSLALLSLSSSSGAVASSLCDQVQNNLVTNCGFETGDFTGWTLSGNTGNRGGYYYGVDAIDAFSGNYGAYLGPLGRSAGSRRKPGHTDGSRVLSRLLA